MNPEIEKRFKELEQQIRNLREARDVVQTESIRSRVLEDVITGTVVANPDAALDQAVAEGGSASYIVAAEYDKQVTVTVDGTDYKIGLYNI